MDDSLRERVDALERTVADGEFEAGNPGALNERLSDLESRLDTVESTLDELEAATQALRGYVGNVRAVNDEVEQRADTAIAKARALEDELEESATNGGQPETAPRARQMPPQGHPAQAGQSGGAAHQKDPMAKNQPEQRCQSCGQVHSGGTAETDGGEARQPRGDSANENALVPGETEETGTLRRIRELL